MLALKITETKNFMNKLLTGDTFSAFLLEQATITTYCTISIEGDVYPDFFDTDEEEKERFAKYHFVSWEKIRPVCLELIKGKHTPLQFQFVLQLRPDLMDDVLAQEVSDQTKAQVQSLLLNIRFGYQGLQVTTGISTTSFLMDKTPDRVWDAYIKQFFTQAGISFEDMISSPL